MQKYSENLSEVIQKELYGLIVVLIGVFLIIAFSWFYNIIYYKKKKKKNPGKFGSAKYIKERRKVFLLCIALTVICMLIGMVQLLDYLDTSAEIKQDIIKESYVVFEGDYSITDINLFLHGYERWMSVEMDDGKYAYVRMNGVFEWLSTDEKEHKGRIVYGENSLVVVDIK